MYGNLQGIWWKWMKMGTPSQFIFFNSSAQLLNRSWWSPFNNWPPGINGPTADKIWIWLLRKHAIYPRPEWWCWVQRRPRRGSPGPTWRSEVEATRMRIALAWKHTPIRPQIRHGRRHQLLGSGTAVSQSMWAHVSPKEMAACSENPRQSLDFGSHRLKDQPLPIRDVQVLPQNISGMRGSLAPRCWTNRSSVGSLGVYRYINPW
jgi:hypothetical protein